MSGSERGLSIVCMQLHAGKLSRVQIVFMRLTLSDLGWQRLSGERARIYDMICLPLIRAQSGAGSVPGRNIPFRNGFGALRYK